MYFISTVETISSACKTEQIKQVHTLKKNTEIKIILRWEAGQIILK